ncbi:MAG: sorbitol-6-phosphate 2-dehydrogenase [bacterium (Candidatus Ratteibacteria) CG_4_10_14_3_um_filter_41_18]|uniref:Sorbitol-6-phosphate 2-dehydrogenase n=4 Tax=Candidatus Ratteibacteria TaxID=2979319 RepID=A0A2M7YG71_9BACT|nr:MAG: sorbitol-6-phosphate 2-dehydrogenase [Candidatus Omnitrophica bacterium CG1_02_41_171]PIV64445.1 MAG: sorbitol-6-phosphate 2-dehydrogenase [bacterium (Candidatus Ratteibacteria) CG01_land_8_20_14_3_00_40_19]PIW33822.1 MAG: sorbitol-6-phosphate 2-dehydrogenase [bacterium (Candidatus Ratteibacteria) CG15_BIG_FIL_POST_REV_8_21_14_020_41_12]PIW74036.1 MAG: sorbitol-6-phosphate 2-dehydrogenase [bacterium (Candidatus Ratteibacteria) CG_4_8_14_3_um_filter_41_36]PIX77293.1 MAG: sorbitol-6-phosp
MKLKNKVAVITGAAQGLGEAIARRFAREGSFLSLLDVDEEKVKAVGKNLEKVYHCSPLTAFVDVTKAETVRRAIERTIEKFGRLDILISNAGILIAEEITEFPEELWRRVIEVNLIGYFICAKEAAKIMKKQGSGVIIQINSKSGKKGSFKNSAYAASKFGGIGLTQSIALELAPYNVRVNSVCPGNLLDSPLWVNSLYDQYAKKWGISKEEVRKKYESQIPLGRGCKYEDVCNLVVFLATEESSYITGQAINVTGGQEMG